MINPTNKYDEKRLNVINKSAFSKFSHQNEAHNDNDNNTFQQTNNDMILINQDYLRKINNNNIFSRPINLCFSNNRFSGALLIPEFKYNKLSTRVATTSSSKPSAVNFMNSEYALFSIANRNCIRLISVPEGRILRTYDSFISSDSRQKQTLKEPRGMCWNYDRSLVLICDSGNNRLVVLKPIFNKKTLTTMNFNLEFEFLFEVSDLTDLNVNPSVNTAKVLDMNKLQYPASVCCNYDYTGDVYISDTFNNRIVCLNRELNLIKTILFGGYNNPFSICLWKQKLIIADTYNNRILIVSIVDGEHEKTIPSAKRHPKNSNNNKNNNEIIIDDDDDDDDDDSINCHKVKRKRLITASSSSSASSSAISPPHHLHHQRLKMCL